MNGSPRIQAKFRERIYSVPDPGRAPYPLAYPKPFKAQVVQECLQPGASISSVAISHGINANVIPNGCRSTEISPQRLITRQT
ncbi:transposase [Pseudomonas sp. Marseille-QA0332]